MTSAILVAPTTESDHVKRILIGAAAFALGSLAFAVPAQAAGPGGQVTKVETGLMDFGPNGYGGISCPAGTTVVEGGYTWAEGAELLDVKIDAAMEPSTTYPHHTTGRGETGWYVQNGEQAQKLNVWAKCKTPLTEVIAVEPDYTKPTCDTTGVIKPKTTEGIKYTPKRIVKGDITVQATVTATAEDGYVLKNAVDGKIVFGPYDVAKVDAKLCIVPQKPDTQDPTCDTPPQYQAEAKGVTYTHEGLPYGDDWYTVKAVAKAGYAIKPGTNVTQWRIDIKWPTNCEQPPTQKPTPNPGGGNPGGGNAGGDNPTPAESESTPVGAELPVTGPGGGVNVPLIGGLAGAALVFIGAAAFLWARKRRNDEVEFTA